MTQDELDYIDGPAPAPITAGPWWQDGAFLFGAGCLGLAVLLAGGAVWLVLGAPR